MTQYLTAALLLIATPLLATTKIDSDKLAVENKETHNVFTFAGNVKVKSETLDIQCDRLRILADKKEAPKPKQSSQPENQGTLIKSDQMGTIQKIIAQGNIKMKQDDRTITAGRATLYPKEGRVVLEDNPVVIDKQGTVKGHRITLNKGEKVAYVEGNPNGERPSVILPDLPDIGINLN